MAARPLHCGAVEGCSGLDANLTGPTNDNTCIRLRWCACFVRNSQRWWRDSDSGIKRKDQRIIEPASKSSPTGRPTTEICPKSKTRTKNTANMPKA